ncbi:hypothetical protein [Streptomyces cucumeris]|uniref:hypothetical protein n=1 Tax=Streptomyces cucumeris TaxID=2962890 RepID=UPI0020C848AB|nr:hypothetical protein [Streptomyces sp. NEAU-Y11]MCP9213486.1 hypothetical protein [Streptomyces sp. NEAU-Y11]
MRVHFTMRGSSPQTDLEVFARDGERRTVWDRSGTCEAKDVWFDVCNLHDSANPYDFSQHYSCARLRKS